MKKIKVKPQEKKIVGKEFNPIEFFGLYKKRILNYSASIAVVILCMLALWRWRENQKADAPAIIIEAKNLFYSGKYDASLNMYKQFLKQFPKHILVPSALVGVAYCYEETGNASEARAFFLEIEKKFPDSPWTDDARKGIERLSSQ